MENFNELNLSESLLKAINEMGFEKPSPIQQKSLPILMGSETDFIGLAATGTGKTAAFTIPMLEKLNSEIRKVQALIMCPTRELAKQVADQVNSIAKYSKIKAQAIYGGSSYSEQINGLKSGAQIVVGTPGRLVDHIERGTLNLEHVKFVILDEADEMISMGFKDELEAVLQAVNRDQANIWLFSATMSKEVRRVADTYLKAPASIQINKTEVVPSAIKQIYYIVRESDKAEILCKMIEVADNFYGIIFCQTKSLVVDLTSYLIDRGYKVDSLHGDKDQKSRERTMQSFRDRKVKILVCTDVASRGLDVKDITHVINYSLPRELDSYVHRIGRTARSGKEGFALSLVTPAQERLVYRIEDMTKSRMQKGEIPSRRQVGEKKVAGLLPKFQTQKFSDKAVELLDETWKALLEGMSKEEIAARFLVMLNPSLFSNNMDERSKMPGPPQRRPESYGGGSRNGDRRREGGRDGQRKGDRNRGERKYDRYESRDKDERRDFDSRRDDSESETRQDRREKKFGKRYDKGGGFKKNRDRDRNKKRGHGRHEHSHRH